MHSVAVFASNLMPMVYNLQCLCIFPKKLVSNAKNNSCKLLNIKVDYVQTRKGSPGQQQEHKDFHPGVEDPESGATKVLLKTSLNLYGVFIEIRHDHYQAQNQWGFNDIRYFFRWVLKNICLNKSQPFLYLGSKVRPSLVPMLSSALLK